MVEKEEEESWMQFVRQKLLLLQLLLLLPLLVVLIILVVLVILVVLINTRNRVSFFVWLFCPWVAKDFFCS